MLFMRSMNIYITEPVVNEDNVDRYVDLITADN